MSRRTKRSSITNHFVDVTLEQYANSRSATSRLKKGILPKSQHGDLFIGNELEICKYSFKKELTLTSFAFGDAVKATSRPELPPLVISTSDNQCSSPFGELEWFERDLADYDEQGDDVRPITQIAVTSQATSDHGRSYPLDLWFLIADYIPPEDVKKFALLCRDAYYVTSTVSFYRRLWRRHRPMRDLSATLRDVCRNVDRSYTSPGSRGYRANVIRGLNYCHPPFVNASSGCDLHALEGTQCIMQWHQLFRQKCMFCFKMRFPSPSSCSCLAHGRNEDLWWNPEHNCCILQVVCENFIDLSSSQMGGLTLTKCHVTVSADMMRHKVKLLFHNTGRSLKKIPLSKYKEVDGKSLTLNSVLHYQVHRWWRQTYNFRNIKDSYR